MSCYFVVGSGTGDAHDAVGRGDGTGGGDGTGDSDGAGVGASSASEGGGDAG